MTWLQRYRIRHFIANSIWIYPVIAIALVIALVRSIHALEGILGWQSDLDPEAARTVVGGLAGSMFTFVVFVCSSLLLVVQLASAQLSPRVIGILFRDPITKLTLALFVFAFTFAMATLIRIHDSVPPLLTPIAIWSSAVCLAVFLILIDRVSKLLRPSGAMWSVASQAHQVIDSVYPQRLKDYPANAAAESRLPDRGPPTTVASLRGGVVLAFDEQGLVRLGTAYDCLIEIVPQVGNLVGPGNPLFRVYGGKGLPLERLCQSIALGIERTMEQDPSLAFRILVDIASKGLSPAINDPTTAVLAIDQIHHLLRHVGTRRLDTEHACDRAGQVRLVYRTPNWVDFVSMAVTEIRHFGGTSIQVARRLRAMLEDLIEMLPEERAEPLRQELQLLRRSAERFFPDPEDQAKAKKRDALGVGGTDESNIAVERPSS